MKYLVFILTHLIVTYAIAAGALVQVPDQCFDKEAAPCLIRALDDASKEMLSHSKIYLSKDALLKITQFPTASTITKADQFKVELLKGKVVVENKVKIPFYLNTVNVGSDEVYYIKKNESLKSIELYKSNEAVFFNVTKNGDVDLVETKDLASRKSTADFIAQFNSIPESLSKQTLAQYETRFNDEVHLQKQVLQRKIAAEEIAQKLDAEARQKEKIQNKKMKDLFFMRTFQQ